MRPRLTFAEGFDILNDGRVAMRMLTAPRNSPEE